jgi:hypothetical protein
MLFSCFWSRACVSQFVKDDPRWVGFRPKLAKWLCLCENYPYRISFLVLVIADHAQKEQVNQLRRKHPLIKEYGLVHYSKGGVKSIVPETPDSTGGKADADNSLELPDGMPIVEAYFRHVERYIYSHPKARKMLSLDGDPVRARAAVHPLWSVIPCTFSVWAIITVVVCLRRRFSPRCSCNQ